MGDAQSVPVLGEVVTIVESGAKLAACGACTVAGGLEYAFTGKDNAALDSAAKLAEGAGQSWVEYSEKNIIVGTMHAVANKVAGDDECADRIFHKTLGSFEGFVDSVPVVGHVKGIGHYIVGNAKHGNKCMLDASRGVVVLGAGLATGGLGGGVALGGLAGVGSGFAYDITSSVIDTAVHDEDRLHGSVAVMDEFNKNEDPNSIVDLTLGLVADFAVGAAGAKGAKQIKKAREIKKQNGVTKAQKSLTTTENLSQLGKDVVVDGDVSMTPIAANKEINNHLTLTGDHNIVNIYLNSPQTRAY